MKNLNLNIMKTDIVSNSGYIYPKDVMKKAVEKFNTKYNEDDPCYCDNNGSTIEADPNKLSHSVANMMLDEDGIISADIKILDTPHGNMLQDVIDTGVEFQSYSKGLATLVDEGTFTVTDYSYLGVSLEPKQEK